MSDYESHSGKLRIVEPKENESFEQMCGRLWVDNGMEPERFTNNPKVLFDELYEKYFLIDGKVWEVFDHEDLGGDDDAICNLHENKDGTYTFYTRFYNGGTCLSEMLSEAIEELEESDEEE